MEEAVASAIGLKHPHARKVVEELISQGSLKTLLADPSLMQDKIKDVMSRLVRRDMENNERDLLNNTN